MSEIHLPCTHTDRSTFSFRMTILLSNTINFFSLGLFGWPYFSIHGTIHGTTHAILSPRIAKIYPHDDLRTTLGWLTDDEARACQIRCSFKTHNHARHGKMCLQDWFSHAAPNSWIRTVPPIQLIFYKMFFCTNLKIFLAVTVRIVLFTRQDITNRKLFAATNRIFAQHTEAKIYNFIQREY